VIDETTSGVDGSTCSWLLLFGGATLRFRGSGGSSDTGRSGALQLRDKCVGGNSDSGASRLIDKGNPMLSGQGWTHI
jgi:hypothetical protein